MELLPLDGREMRQLDLVSDVGVEPMPARVRFGSVMADPLTTEDWLRRLVNDSRRRRAGLQPARIATSLNAATVSRAHRDARLRTALAQFDYVDVDGMSLVYWSRVCKGPTVPERVATTDFIHSVAAVSERQDLSFFLLGATETVNRGAAQQLERLYPRLRIVGRHHGYFDSDATVIDLINRSGADVVWVAMGVPNEHEFILRNRDRFARAVWVKSCGGCLDFLNGRVRRAPAWIQKVGLEWFFRVMQEPRRLFWRYATTNPHAFVLMLQQFWQER